MKRPYSSLALWSWLRWSQIATRTRFGYSTERRIPLEEGLRHFVVGELLVGDTSSVLVHIDHRIAGRRECADQRWIARSRAFSKTIGHIQP